MKSIYHILNKEDLKSVNPSAVFKRQRKNSVSRIRLFWNTQTDMFLPKGVMNTIQVVLLLVATSLYAQQTPGLPQAEPVTIQGATIHVGNGEVIQNGTLVFENGKITAVGSSVSPKGKIIDASGQHLYPGFIIPYNSLGLVEIDA